MEEELPLNNKQPEHSKAAGKKQPIASSAAPPAEQPRFQAGMSNEELVNAFVSMSEDQLIPWEDCYLPSEGRYYKDANGNHWPDGMVKVRPMNQTAEKVLATGRLVESGQAIDYLFRECVKLPDGFDPVDLLIPDRTFLLYYIRGVTHGNEYEFAVDCPNDDCGKKGIHQYDLNELYGTIRKPDPTLGDEPFKVVLPYASKLAGKDVWVQVRLLRGIDIQNMVARRKAKARTMVRPGQSQNPFQRRLQQQQENRVQLDQSLTEIMERNVVSVLGVNDPRVVAQFVGRLHATDSATIREFLRENTPGIDTTVNITCSHCTHNFTVELPVSESFFRPQAKS